MSWILRAGSSRALSLAGQVLSVVCLLGLSALELWYLVVRAGSARYQLLYNEGWNAYHARAVSQGFRLYGAAPGYTAVNYPPLSFHLVGAFGSWIGDYNYAGRLLSLMALFWVSVCAGLVAWRMLGHRFAAILAGSLCLAWFVFFAPYYAGVNEPQLLGHAFVLTGLLLYVSRPESASFCVLACLACCAGGFVKHNLLPFPLAIGLDLLWRSRKRFTIWVSAAVGFLGLFTACSLLLDGPYLFQHLLVPRQISVGRGAHNTVMFLLPFLCPLVASLASCRRLLYRPVLRTLVFALPLSLAMGALASCGSAVNLNAFFDAVIAMAVLSAIAVGAYYEETARSWAGAVALVFLPLLLSSGPVFYPLGYAPLVPNAQARRGMERETRAFLEDVEYLKRKPGPAICLDLLLCFEAGKPLVFDPFSAYERQVKDARYWEKLAAELEEAQYAVVQLDSTKLSAQAIPYQALWSRYHVDRESSERIFYTPGPRATAAR